MTSDYRARRDRLRAMLRADDGPFEGLSPDVPLGGFVVSDLVNVRYLTGFTGSNASVLIDAEDPGADRIGTDGRYVTQVGTQAPDLDAIIERNTTVALLGHAFQNGRTVVGFEADAITVGQYQSIVTTLAEDQVTPGIVAASGAVEALREVKDEVEVAALRRAATVADEALATIIDRGMIRAGATEREVARALEWEMYARGADAIAFETIVAAGPNSAVPHHRPTSAVLAAGDLVKIDFGAVVDGYHSDMTRTYVLGHAADWQREIYDLVTRAQAAGRAALQPGADLAAVDAAARTVIADAGYGEHYVHGLGHGVGLQIHEAPGIGVTATGTLPCGAAVTVEPGVYLPGRGGVRIEDTLVVRDDAPELLTATDKAFTVL